MKKLFIILLLLTSTVCYAQDYCNDIRKTSSELTGTTIYRSHFVMADYRIGTSKIITAKDTATYMIFTADATFLDFRRTGIFIKFDDGTIYKDPNLKVNVAVQTEPYWRYTATLPITKELQEKFINHKITQANFLSHDFDVTPDAATHLIQYLVCLNGAK